MPSLMSSESDLNHDSRASNHSNNKNLQVINMFCAYAQSSQHFSCDLIQIMQKCYNISNTPMQHRLFYACNKYPLVATNYGEIGSQSHNIRIIETNICNNTNPLKE